MKNSKQTFVYGQSAPAPKVTKAAVVLVATVIAVPVFLLLSLVEWLLL